MANTTMARDPAPLTGTKVLLALLAFFGVVFAINGLMAYDALSTFRGEVVDHPYELGLAFNAEIASAEAQAARDWRVEASFARDGAARAAQVLFADAEGRAIEGLDVSGVFAAPADKRRDQAFALQETTPGTYAGQTLLAKGVWDFELVAKRDGKPLFRTKNRVTLD